MMFNFQWGRVLPQVLAEITGHPRHKVNIEWSSKSWTHNMFRFWEIIFWRRCGENGVGDTIRFESSSVAQFNYETRKLMITYSFGTWEAFFAHIETGIRILFKKFPKFKFVKVPVPGYSFAGGYGVIDHRGAYSFAIAFDADSGAKDNSGAVTSITWSHTTTGSNTFMTLNGGTTSTNGASITHDSFTYNSVGSTNVQTATAGTEVQCTLWYLVAPTSGANNAVLTISAVLTGGGKQLNGVVATYSGASQTGQPDSSNKNTAPASTTTNFAVSTTVVASNCWISGSATENAGDIAAGSAGAQTTYRGAAQFNQRGADSNGTVGTGAQALNYGRAGSSGDLAGCTLSFAPASEAGGAVTPRFLSLLGVG